MRPTHAGLFHVTARSIAEEHIFRDDRDYHAGVQILAELAMAKFFDCHDFCLMPTHYHLLASFRQDMLSDAVHRLNRRYAGGFNRRHRRRGHVFDSPFAAVEVVTEGHAFRLLDYIAENPPYRPWPWSSFDADFSFVERLPWLETHEPGSKSEPGSKPFARSSASADSVFSGDSPIAARM
jgi:putative transposase